MLRNVHVFVVLNCKTMATTVIYFLSLHDALPISRTSMGNLTRRPLPLMKSRTSVMTARAWCLGNPYSISQNLTSRGLVNRSEENTSELQSHVKVVCRLRLEKKKYMTNPDNIVESI